MKKILFLICLFVSVTGYSQSSTKGALSTLDTAFKPTIKMVAVSVLDNNFVYWDGTKWSVIQASGSVITNPVFSNPQYNSTTSTNYWRFVDGQRFALFRRDTTYESSGPITNLDIFLGRNAGTLDAKGGGSNLGIMDSALARITSGFGNVAIGEQALSNATNSNYSTGIGYYAGRNNNASGLLAIGNKAALLNTTGMFNIAIGTSALKEGTTGGSNVAVGTSNYQYTRVGSYNTGMGSGVFAHSDSGSHNTGFGWHIHHYGQFGQYNTYVGSAVSETENGGNNNAFFGYYAMHYNNSLDSMIVFNSLDRGNLDGDTSKSPFVSYETTDMSTQRTKINGLLQYTNGMILPALQFNGTATDKFWRLATGERIFTLRDDTTGFATDGVDGLSIYLGRNSGNLTSAGSNLIGIGDSTMVSVTTGDDAVAIGSKALKNNTTGSWNVAVGINALRDNNIGITNTAVGYNSMRLNTTGNYNTIIGSQAGESFVSGVNNVAVGALALRNFDATTYVGSNNAGQNTAIGMYAMSTLTGGTNNAALGYRAMFASTLGLGNTAIGSFALRQTTTGNVNTVLGDSAMYNNTTGSNNIALGYAAGLNQTTANGYFFVGNGAKNTNAANDLLYHLLVGTLSLTADSKAGQNLLINGTLTVGTSTTPASAAAAGVAGTIAWDANFIYVATATNTWKRVAIATW